jgi:ubiquinone/menaquinone biosynthesis C-methylase UbiE
MKRVVKQDGVKGIFPSRFAFTLLIPLRNLFFSPRQLIERLELQEHSAVLEVGPGPGYFSGKIARALPYGKLVLADIQQKMLDYAKKRIDKRGLSNVSYHLCDGETFPFADSSFDKIFLVAVLGEIENRSAYLKEFYRMLKRDGILSFTELAGDPDKISVEDLKQMAQGAGFVFYRLYGNKWNYTVNFKRNTL